MTEQIEQAEQIEDDDPSEHQIVVASNREQMQVAQQGLVTWTDKRIASLRADLLTAGENLESARRHKWKISGYQAQVRKLVHNIEFYEKLKTAVEMGYTIIPNFDGIDIFAIRRGSTTDS